MTARFPDDFFVSLGGPLRSYFEQLMGAVDLPDRALERSNTGTEHGVTSITDAKRSFDVAIPPKPTRPILANTAFYTYTPKSVIHRTYFLKGLDNSYTEAEILADLQALQIRTEVRRCSKTRNKSKPGHREPSTIILLPKPPHNRNSLFIENNKPM